MDSKLQSIIDSLPLAAYMKEYLTSMNFDGESQRPQLIERLFKYSTYYCKPELAIPLVNDETSAKTLMIHLLDNKARLSEHWDKTYRGFFDHCRSIGLVYDRASRNFYRKSNDNAR